VETEKQCPYFHDHSQILTRDEVHNVVRETVRETLLSMGVDTTDPIEMQRDFQAVRDWRLVCEAIRSKGLMTLVGILIAGVLGALLVGLKDVILRP
jgi:hypothetical protein